MVDARYPSHIDGYRVIRLLGSGGMGEVYLVDHPRLPRLDALKLLDATVSRNQQFRARFNREADLLARLRHPNIITAYDRGEFEGRMWLSMEYLDGQDAAAALRRPSLMPLDLAVRIIDGAGKALDYAYAEHRITHRDVKPANILLEFGPEDSLKTVKLADFGIAKAAAESTALTSAGVAIGTLAYISPEAIEGRELDNRADIYSLGCTAFELLTGEPPYTAGTIPALMRAHVAQPVPSITARNSRLPKHLDEVFARVLAKDPAQRFATCAEFVDVLRQAPGKAAPKTVANVDDWSHFHGRPTVAAATEEQAAKAGAGPSTHPWWRRRAVLALLAVVLTSTASGIVVTRYGMPDINSGKPALSPSSATVPVAPTTTSTVAAAPSSTTVVTTSVESAPPYALPGCVRAPNLVLERPASANPMCNRSHWIQELTWTSWGPSGAEGTGIEEFTNCDPSCATGETFRNPVHVLFAGSAPASGDSGCPTTFRYYTQMIVAYPDLTEIPFPVPPSDPTGLGAVVTRYNNMPATRWNNLPNDCNSPNI